jgi:AraC-like DNA-binding protein
MGEVSERVGFPLPQRFAAAFRAATGLTPTAFRGRHAAGQKMYRIGQ